MRRAAILLVLWVGASDVSAQDSKKTTPDEAIAYWERKPKSVIRDTTLIRLYSQQAETITELDSSLVWLQKGFTLAFQLRSSRWLAYTHNRIGATYLQKGVNFKAIEYLFRGVQYAEKAKVPSEQAFAWNHIGDCYANLKTYHKAITAEKRAIRLFEQTRNLTGQKGAMVDLGGAYRENNQLDAAIAILQRSLDINKALEFSDEQTDAYFNLAATFLKKEDFNEAEKHGLLALDADVSNRGRASAELLSLLSLVYGRSGKATESRNYASRAEYFLIYEAPAMRERVAFNLYEAYKSLQKPEEALAWHEKYLAQREINRADAQNKRLEVLRYEYDARQRDEQMQLLTQDMADQAYLRNALIAGVLLFLGLAVALGRSNRLLSKRRQELHLSNAQLSEVGEMLQLTNVTLEERVAARTNELREANLTLTRKNHEIQEALFRGQSIERERVASELHNNLGSLLSGVKWRLESVELENLTPTERMQYQSVVGLITDAYNQVRHISHNLLPSILEKKGLVPALEKLIGDLNRSGRARFELTHAADIRIENKKVSFELYSCMLELINNILKHANARQVALEIVQTDRFYILLITDDGTGIGTAKTTTQGKGLENIRQRMNSLNGTFTIRSLRNKPGTTVTLRVPRLSTLSEA